MKNNALTTEMKKNCFGYKVTASINKETVEDAMTTAIIVTVAGAVLPPAANLAADGIRTAGRAACGLGKSAVNCLKKAVGKKNKKDELK